MIIKKMALYQKVKGEKSFLVSMHFITLVDLWGSSMNEAPPVQYQHNNNILSVRPDHSGVKEGIMEQVRVQNTYF